MAEDWRATAAQRAKEKSAGRRFKLSEGENRIRILPRKQPDGKLGGAPWHEFMQHQNIGPNTRFVACGKNIYGEGECWLCDVQMPKLKQSAKEQVRARAAGLVPKEQFIVQVSIVDNDTEKFGDPQIWAVPNSSSKSIAQQLLTTLKSTKRDYISLSKGYCINIERTGTTFKGTHYGGLVPDLEPTAVPASVVAKMKTFDELADQYSESVQQAAYYGREVEEEEVEAEPTAEAYEEVVDEPNDENEMPNEEAEDVSEDAEEPTEDSEDSSEFGEEPAEEQAEEVSEEFEDIFNEPEPEPEPAPRPAVKKKAATPAPATGTRTNTPPARPAATQTRQAPATQRPAAPAPTRQAPTTAVKKKSAVKK